VVKPKALPFDSVTASSARRTMVSTASRRMAASASESSSRA
jgi:hypothetical protein